MAYSGPSAKRIMNFLLSDRYGVCLNYPMRSREYFEQFLHENHIYVTSAVKCTVRGNPQSLNYGVIARCRQKFLDRQIATFDSLRIIVPMGKVAAAAVLRRLPDTFQLKDVLGAWSRGIFHEDPYYGKKLVVLPHPSGASRAANPPIFSHGERAEVIRQKARFRRALSVLRDFLFDSGYNLRPLPANFRGGVPEDSLTEL